MTTNCQDESLLRGEFTSKASPRRYPTRSGSWKEISSPLYQGMEIIHPASPTKYLEEPASEEAPPVENGLSDKGTFSTFMEKEIFEQPESTERTCKGRLDFENFKVTLRGIEPHMDEILRCRRLLMIGAGSSFHCAIGTRQLIEELTELPVMVELASDLLDREIPVFRDDVCIFISQSGETTSVLNAMRYCKRRDALVVGITNTVNSTLSRETYCGIHANAGLEVGVASTKAFTAQFVTLILFALLMAEDKMSKQSRIKEIINGLKELPDQMRRVLQLNDRIREIATQLKDEKSVLVIGRGYQNVTCMEGAFKLKEVAYIHSEGILAGELKHGSLALIDKDMPVIMVVVKDATYDKCMNAVQQVTARHGRPIIICTEGDLDTIKHSEQNIILPATVDCLQSLLTIIPLQLLSMHLASERNQDVDRPRNLVKAVIEDN